MNAPVTAAPAAQKTIDITAEDFLMAIFAEDGGAIGIADRSKDGWNARRWVTGMDLSGPTYACISTIVDDNPRATRLARSEDNLVKTYAFMLDDIGTAENSKVPPERIKLQPSWKLETSPGNFQWGYIFKSGVDPVDAKALIKALLDAGVGDKASHSANRYMRLPGSTKNGFAARLHEWLPDRLHTRSQIAQGFGVVPADTPPLPDYSSNELPPGVEDPVLKWLAENGHVAGGQKGNGWVDLRECPNAAEHTDHDPLGAGYRPGIRGGFRCFHEHCLTFNTSKLKDWILKKDPAARLETDLGALGSKLAAAMMAPEQKHALAARYRELLKNQGDLVQLLAQAMDRLALSPWCCPTRM
jgi:RepB DNA-primase from phage plasmid